MVEFAIDNGVLEAGRYLGFELVDQVVQLDECSGGLWWVFQRVTFAIRRRCVTRVAGIGKTFEPDIEVLYLREQHGRLDVQNK